jgi:hypothetical protein
MSKSVQWLILVFVFVIVSCKKDAGSSINNLLGYHITLVSGDNQTDTIGMALHDTLIFKSTKNDQMLSFGYVEVYGYDCAGNPLPAMLYAVGTNSKSGFFTRHVWWLNGNIGSQKLTAVLMDSLMNRKDSVTVTATGRPPSHGWYHSGCFPVNNFVKSFAQLPSGRVLAALWQPDYPYYSDDEGVTWQPLATTPSRDSYTIIISNDSNEVFLASSTNGMLHSPDGGMTWEVRNSGLPSINNRWGDLQYTKSGKLFSNTGVGVFKSDDKGLNWHSISYGLIGYSFGGASSSTDGTIYAKNYTMVQSTDGGEGFHPLYSFESADYFFVDSNDDMYATSYGNVLAEGTYINRSQDKAQTWSKIATMPMPNDGYQHGVSNMSRHGESYFFYTTTENLLVETRDFISFYFHKPPIVDNGGRQSIQYIVTKKGHIIMSNEFQGLFYFIP